MAVPWLHWLVAGNRQRERGDRAQRVHRAAGGDREEARRAALRWRLRQLRALVERQGDLPEGVLEALGEGEEDLGERARQAPDGGVVETARPVEDRDGEPAPLVADEEG